MKKVLAWAVVLALVLSSFTMAFAGEGAKSSKDFKDASEIQYTEAVDVMVATGVINGFPDGTFGPQKTVERGQMAKMIAVIMNGGEDVGDQYKSACPFADSKDHWAAGYIAYCASQHIIDGRSADVFDPKATVTGTEVAKMALTSLGYDSKIQGYTGESWAANVLKDAKKNELFKGLDSSFVPGDPCPREAAAQILFNMLQAVEVEYDNNTSISVGDDTQVVVSSKAVKKESKDNREIPDDNGDTFVNLYEDVFGGELEFDKYSGDDFGNPGHTWTFEDEEVGTYLDSPDYEFIAQAAGFGPALEKFDKSLSKAYTKKNLVVEVVVVNGAYGSEENAPIGTGDKVKMYKIASEDGKDYYGVVVEQYIAYQITDVKEASEDEAEDGITAKVTFATNFAADGFDFEFVDVEDVDIPNFDAETYVKGAVIAVAPKYGNPEGTGTTQPLDPSPATASEMIDSYVMEELASGTPTKIKDNTVTIDGTAYEEATNYNAVDGETIAAKKAFTLYNYNEFALASTLVPEEDPAEPEVFYGILTKKGQTSADEFGEGGAPLARIFTAEGSEARFVVNLDTKKSEVKEYGSVEENTLIAYTKNEAGEIDTIALADPAPSNWENEAVATGDVLYGRELDANIVAFAKVQDTTTDPATEKWVVYDLDALKAAKAVNVESYKDKEAKLMAIVCESLEPPAAKDEVMGFLAAAPTSFTNAEGDTAYEISIVGEEKPFETNGKVAVSSEYQMGDLVILTKDGDLVSAIEFADCVGIPDATTDIPSGAQAAFYGVGPYATEYVYKVIGVSSNSLNVGKAAEGETPAYNKYQACTNAKVYYAEFGSNGVAKFEASDLSKIAKDNYVILMKLDNASKVWDTVIFAKDIPSSITPANGWDIPTTVEP